MTDTILKGPKFSGNVCENLSDVLLLKKIMFLFNENLKGKYHVLWSSKPPCADLKEPAMREWRKEAHLLHTRGQGRPPDILTALVQAWSTSELQIDLPAPLPPAPLWDQCALNFFALILQPDKSIIRSAVAKAILFLSFCRSAAGHVALQTIGLH